MMEYVMELEGADFGKLTLIPNTITDEPAALQAKQTDAVWVFYGWSGINAEVQQMECDYFAFRDISEALDYYTPIIIANNTFLEEFPEDTKTFLNATRKGYEYAIAHPVEAADLLMEGDTTGSLQASKDLVYASQEWISKQYIDEGQVWGVIDETRWNGFYQWLYENQLTSHDLTGKGFSNQYIEN